MDRENPKFWIALYHHRHGTDVIPFFRDKEPNDKALIGSVDNYEPHKGEWFDVRGPFYVKGCP